MRPARTLVMSVVVMLSILGLWNPRPAVSAAGSDPTPGLTSALPAAAAVRGPVVVIQTEAGQPAQTLAVVKADINVAIAGPLAQTTQILTFRNDTARVLEGELVFPLPEGATVSGYGLDVDGQIVDAVPVEKQEARIIFEKEVRKGVDPGLVEFVQGNNFRTRLYPIRANSTRTVKIQYVSDLVTTGNKGQPAYHLPLNFAGKLDVFQLHIEVVKGAAKTEVRGPEIRGGGDALGNFAFKEQDGKYIAHLAGEQMQPKNDLVIALPQPTAGQAMVEKDEAGKDTYFVVNDVPAIPPIPTTAPAHRAIAIAWDASLSRAAADKSRELSIIKKLLENDPFIELDILVFRDQPDPLQEFDVTDNPWNFDHPVVGINWISPDGVVKFLKGLAYDGATDLGKVSFVAKQPIENHPTFQATIAMRRFQKYDYWLLFSDGMGTLGQELPKVVEAPIYAINSATSANHAVLRHLAETSGGKYFNLARVKDEQVVAAIGAPVYSFLKAEYDPKEIAEVTPAGTRAVEGRFLLTGKLLVPEAKITLHYGFPGQADVSTTTFTVKQAEAVGTGGMVPRYWAQQKAAELALLPDQNHDELLKIGRQFNLVTPNTSLLVLETLEQHLQYSIPPAKSRTDLYNKYLEEIEKRNTVVAKTRAEKLDQVVKMWTEKVKWWETEFKYDKGFVWKGQPGATTRPSDLTVAWAETQPALSYSYTRQGTGGVVSTGTPALVPRDPTTPAPFGAPNGNDRSAREVQIEAGVPILGGAFGEAGKDDKSGNSGASAAAAIQIKPWDPKTPYMEAIRNAGKGATDVTAYDVYLQQRAQYGASPAFYLDVADYLLRQGQRDLGVRVLTNIVEMKLQSPALLRVAAYRLLQEGDARSLDLAIDLLEKVFRLRPEEPQSYRDLALALASRAAVKTDPLAAPGANFALLGMVDLLQGWADYERALGLLNEVVTKSWDGRFPEIELIALMEANRIAAKMERLIRTGRINKSINDPLDPRLRKLLDVDVRIVLTWDADATDIDLWVTEPTGETCVYNHNRTTIGGALSKDFTQGYGPEEYCLRKALAGKYIIKANYYGSRQQTLSGPCTVRATVITNFGRADENRQDLTLRLTDQKETVEVGAVTIGGSAR